jgi:type I restriction enzyme, S subunit
LDEAFAGLETLRANAEKNLQNARGLLENVLDGITNNHHSDWHEGNLGEIGGEVFTGPFGSLLHKSDYVTGGTPLVNPAHIIGDRIVPDVDKTVCGDSLSRLSSYRLQAGDIVIGRRGEIGRCAVVTDIESGWLCGTGSFFIRIRKAVNPHFLANLLRSKSYRHRLESASSGATMLNLSNTTLRDLLIRLPPREFQDQAVGIIENLTQEVDNLSCVYQRKLDALDELKKSLLHEAFAGKL